MSHSDDLCSHLPPPNPRSPRSIALPCVSSPPPPHFAERCVTEAINALSIVGNKSKTQSNLVLAPGEASQEHKHL